MAKTIKKHGKTVLILGLLMVGVMWYLTSLPGQAGQNTLESDTLTDSRPTTTANHTIYFAVSAAPTSSASTITLDFDNSFSFAGVTTSDIDFATSTATSNCATATYNDYPLYEDATAARWGWSTSAGSIMTFSPETDVSNESMTTSTCVMIRIGTNATSTAGYSTGANRITNGWPGVKDIDIGGGFGQTGKIKVAIIEGVVVTASITETLTAAVYASSTCGDLIAGGTVDISSTTTTIPYGTVNAEDFYDACQHLEIGTNAGSGYTATLQKTQRLTAGSNTVAEGGWGGTTTTEATWAADTDNGFGYCMKDRTLAGAQVADVGWSGTTACGGGSQSFKVIGNSSTDAQNIMKSSTATSTNLAYVGYRLSLDSAQAAGDYTTTLIYIVTPTY